MTEEEFWKRKRYALRGLLGGSVLFVMITISMLVGMDGVDTGIFGTLVNFRIPFGIVLLIGLLIFNVKQINETLRWPK